MVRNLAFIGADVTDAQPPAGLNKLSQSVSRLEADGRLIAPIEMSLARAGSLQPSRLLVKTIGASVSVLAPRSQLGVLSAMCAHMPLPPPPPPPPPPACLDISMT
jgi:hypothetical protein